MIVKAKNSKPILLRKLNSDDHDDLVEYLQHLSPETKARFGPHQFDRHSIDSLYQDSHIYLGYVALRKDNDQIVAYSIVKIGYLEHDRFRLESYGLKLDPVSDCTFAPSVSDSWQGLGIGKLLFNFILSDLKNRGMKRIILWGGVQVRNEKAVNYYLKSGFNTLGQFQYNGENYDMCFDIN